ncbi:MAG: sodium/solute symporter [Pirellulales bacterium]
MPEEIVHVGSASSLAAIDLAIIVVYMIGMQLVGMFYARYVHSAGDFFLAGRALPFWAVGVSIVASDIGAIDLITGSGAAYQHGVAQANFDWLGSVPAVLLAAFIFLPYYWRAGVYTIPEFLGRRYNAGVQWLQALIWLAFMGVNVALMLWTSAVILQTVLGWSPEFAIAVTAILVGLYTVTGGLAAVVMTDVLQVVVMFVGAGALTVLSVWDAGGWSHMSQTILNQPDTTQNFFTLLVPHGEATPYPWTGIVFGLGIVMSTAYFVGNQAILQRALGARSEWDAKAGMIVAGFLKLLIPMLMFVPGIAARALYPDLDKPDSAVPTLVRDLMPAGLRGLMFAAFFAALMSSVDSYLNSWTTVFISDLYSKLHRALAGRPLSDHRALVLSRWLTASLLVVAAFVAPVIERFETIYVALQTMLSFFQGPTLAILLLGILWRRATGWGGLIGLLCGVTMTMGLSWLGGDVFPTEDPFLFVSFWSFWFTLAVTVVASLLTRPEPPEKLRGLVYGDVLRDPTAQALLAERMPNHG